MKTLKNTTKAAARFINSYNNSRRNSLRDCYTKYSTAKACAERECKRKMENENGYNFKILSFNTFGFSCAWTTENGLRIETPSTSYLVS